MSETDDTDVLLLIPPNFFLVPSSGSEESLLESSRTVVHKPTSCTAQVIGKLFDQVYTLENRLESLELSSVSDTISSRCARSCSKTLDSTKSFDSSDRKYSTYPRRRRKRNFSNQSKQVLTPTSLDSNISYGKKIPRLQFKTIEYAKSSTDSLVDDLPSMDGDLSSIISTPSKKTDRLLLNEIDEFLTKVETYESPESKYKDPDSTLSPENVIKATSDYIAHKLDVKNVEEVKLTNHRTVPSNVLDKYIYLVNNNANSSQAEKPYVSNKIQPSCESVKHDVTPKTSYDSTKTSRDSKSPGVRKLNFADTSKDVQQTSTPKRVTNTSNYLDSFRPSSNKIYDRATKVLEQYKAQNSKTQNSIEPVSQKEEFKRPYNPDTHRECNPESQLQYTSDFTKHGLQSYHLQSQKQYPSYRPIEMKEPPKLGLMQSKFLDTIDTELLSLSDLWGERKNGVEKVDSLKLEEEKMKREHCEAIIQELQRKLLEQQERLAIAIKVDRSKDSVIAKLKEAWLRVTSSLDKAEERHRTVLEKMNRELDNFRVVADDAQKKTSHFEAELYKTLDLAHDYQEKCKQLTADKKELQEIMEKQLAGKDDVIRTKDRDLEALRENFEAVMRLNKQSSDCVKNVDDALEKEKQEHDSTRHQLSELNRKLQSVQDETAIVLRERDVLKEKVNEERARCNILESQLAEKQNLCSELFRKCDAVDNEVKSLRRQLELQKSELKTHYQKQLEDAVLAKLQEFQLQLDRAEKEMEDENRNKENALVDTFNKQMSRIEEQHKLEINVLEEKHKEEIKLYRLQLVHSGDKVTSLENKVEAHRARRGDLARRLHAVMQAQWSEALAILTGPAHPAHQAHPAHPAHVAHPALPEHTASSPCAQDYVAPKIPPLTLSAFPRREPAHPAHLAHLAHLAHPDRLDRLEGLSDSELQHYVKLLLTKPAQYDTSADTTLKDDREGPTERGSHVREGPTERGSHVREGPTERGSHVREGPVERAPLVCEEPTSDRPDRDKEKRSKRSLSLGKPPWKS